MSKSSIFDILKSYTNDLPVNQDWYKDRLDKCLECPLNTKNGASLKPWMKVVEKTVVNKEFGQCSLCGCPTERKTSLKNESCPDEPSRWESIQTEATKGKGLISDLFRIEAKRGIKSINVRNGVFEIEGIDSESALFLELNVFTLFDGKSIKFNPSCSCTTGFITKIDDNHYQLKVKIDKEDKGLHRVTFSTTFSRNNLSGRSATVDLFMKVNYNKI